MPLKITLQGDPQTLDEGLLTWLRPGAQDTPATPPPTTPATPAPPATLGTVGGVKGVLGTVQPEATPAPVTAPHRSLIGNVGRVLGQIGQAAGSTLIPGVMPWIPGTAQHRMLLEQMDQQQQEFAIEQAHQQALTDYEKAQAERLRRPEKPQRPEIVTGEDGSMYTVKYDERGQVQLSPLMTGEQQPLRAQPKTESATPLGDRVTQLNQIMNRRYQVLNPSAMLPPEFTLGPEATQKDYDRVDKALEAHERAYGTKAQQDIANDMRRQTLQIAQQGLELRKSMAGQGAGSGNPNMEGQAYLESLPSSERNLVEAIGTGRIAPDRMGYLLARNQKLLNDVMQAFPTTFDSSKVQSYPAVYKNFTSGKVSVALNAGSTALRHLAQLKRINDANPTEVRIPGTAANKAYNNLLDTVADELGTFYGEPKTNEVIQSKKATLGGLLNRDAAIREQAIAMGVKFDEFENTWKNAAPSGLYQAPMPAYSEEAKKARALLDPSYQPNASGGVRTGAMPKVGETKKNSHGDTVKWNGKAYELVTSAP